MATSGFPQRSSQGAGGMTGGMSSVLDGPPPSPAMPMEMPQAGQSAPMPSMGEMSRPLTAGTPGRAVAPEIVQGVLQSGETISGMLDSMASIFPDLALDFSLVQDTLQRALAKIVVQGGPRQGAGATGMNFPGGGFAAGAM